jgi:hypothetical protein
LRTFDGRRSRFKTDVASEAAGVAGNVAAAVVRQSFDGDWHRFGRINRLGLFAKQPMKLTNLIAQSPIIRRRHDLFAGCQRLLGCLTPPIGAM